MNKWATLGEIAEYLRMSKDSVYARAKAGKIPAYKLGRQWRFSVEEVDEWVRNGQTPIKEEEKTSKNNSPPFKKEEKDFLNSLTLPEKLRTQEFQDIWISWIRHRQEIRHTLKPETVKRQLAFLVKQPNPVACIEQSIRQGWQGLFPVGYEKKSIIDDRNQIKRMFEPTNEELDEKYKNFR